MEAIKDFVLERLCDHFEIRLDCLQQMGEEA